MKGQIYAKLVATRVPTNTGEPGKIENFVQSFTQRVCDSIFIIVNRFWTFVNILILQFTSSDLWDESTASQSQTKMFSVNNLLNSKCLGFCAVLTVFLFCSGRHGVDPHGAERSLRADAASPVQPRRVPHRPPDGPQRRRADRSLLHTALYREICQRCKIWSICVCIT